MQPSLSPIAIGQTPFLLDDVRIDPLEGTLERKGDVVRLQPKVMEVLVFLAQHHGQVISKETLLENVWAERFVVDGVLRRCILRIRKALDEDARAPRYLETLPRRGYRLLIAPEVIEAEPPVPDETTQTSPGNPSLASVTPIRPNQNPFRGLESFDAEHADFFFGRRSELSQVMSAFAHQLNSNRGFVLLLGPSGSGKSSLARAAVLPALAEPDSLDVAGKRFCCTFMVSSNPTAPLRQLAQNVCDALGAQPSGDRGDDRGNDQGADEAPEQLAGIAGEDTGAALELVTSMLDQHHEEARLVVLLDQFEEWFSYPDINDEVRTQFFDLLYALARSGRVWFVAAMRSEFYPLFMQFESLRYLKSPAGQVDIGFPRASQIAEIVRKPAALAGLEFGEDTSGRTLDQDLIDAAASSPASLPLLQFALEQLFWRRDKNTLRHSDLDALGGLEGCLGKQAEDTFLALSPEARSALPTVLEAMLMVSGDMDRVTRRAAPLSLFDADTPTNEMVVAMIEARLFSTQLDRATGQPVVQFAHEAVISHWQRARTWIEQNVATLRFRAWLSESAQRWRDGGENTSDLIAGGSTLIEAARLSKSDPTLGTLEHRFVNHSERQADRQARRGQMITAALAVLTICALGFATSAVRQGQLAKQRQLTAISEAQRAQSTTEFMASLFAGADPGSNQGKTLSATELLDRGAARIDDALANAPESKAALMTTIAESYMFLGDTDKARKLVANALLIAQDIDPKVSRVPADVSLEMAGLLRETGRYEQALLFARQAEKQAQQHNDPWLVIKTRNLHGMVLYESGEVDEAVDYLKDVLARAVNLDTPDIRQLAGIHNNLALSYLDGGNKALAEQHLMQAIELGGESGDVRFGARANRLNNLAILRNDQGRLDEAQALYSESISLLEQAYGPAHPALIRTLFNLGTLQLRTAGLEPALASFKKAGLNSAGTNPTIDALIKAKLALCAGLLDTEQALAAELTNDMVQLLADTYGDDHRVVAEAQAAVAIRALRAGGADDAREQLQNARDAINNSGDGIPAVIVELDRLLQSP